MERRDFLISAAAMAGLAAAGCARPAAMAVRGSGPMSRIAIMGWSFDSIIKRPGRESETERTLDILDLPQMYVDRYGVHDIEMQQVHFASTEPAYLREFRERVERAGSRVTQINLEFDASLSAPSNTRRLEAIDLTKRWIHHAQAVGSPRVMVNQGALEPENRAAAVETLRTMAEYGRANGVMVTVENRGGNWEPTVELVRAAGARMNPDLGFPDQEQQLRGLRLMYPMHSGSVHVKMNPERYDLPTAIRLLEELGYDGLYSIEAPSRSPDPYASVQQYIDVVLATI